jgi:type II secretory pathway component PulJ
MNRTPGHRGITLVEVLMTITASSVILAAAGALLHRSLRLESASRGVLAAERTALSLARRFRADVHAARAVACTADELPEGVVLTATPAAGPEIVYRAVRGGLVREEKTAADRIAREAFGFPVEVQFRTVRAGRLVSLVGAGGGTAETGPPVEIEVVAQMGAAQPEATP